MVTAPTRARSPDAAGAVQACAAARRRELQGEGVGAHMQRAHLQAVRALRHAQHELAVQRADLGHRRDDLLAGVFRIHVLRPRPRRQQRARRLPQGRPAARPAAGRRSRAERARQCGRGPRRDPAPASRAHLAATAARPGRAGRAAGRASRTPPSPAWQGPPLPARPGRARMPRTTTENCALPLSSTCE